MKKLIATIAVVAACSLLWTATAQAWRTSCSGYCGGMTVGKVRGITYPFGPTQLQFLSRNIYRANYSGSQRITLQYKVYWWNGGTRRYVLYPANLTYGSPWLRSGQWWALRPFSINVFPQRYHTVDLVVRWYRGSDGARIGTRVLEFAHTGDYLCGGVVHCSIGYVGGYGAIYNAFG